ncbi:hypothetical protein V5799_032939 [Amblyomma americanum]|uniref:Uncharacterized protein n=1 Tax=Amblyomma americanum TaxID=6943 RepID=A0AAQ4DPR3_AMBAM
MEFVKTDCFTIGLLNAVLSCTRKFSVTSYIWLLRGLPLKLATEHHVFLTNQSAENTCGTENPDLPAWNLPHADYHQPPSSTSPAPTGIKTDLRCSLVSGRGGSPRNMRLTSPFLFLIQATVVLQLLSSGRNRLQKTSTNRRRGFEQPGTIADCSASKYQAPRRASPTEHSGDV